MLATLLVLTLAAADHKVDPTFLRQTIGASPAAASPLTSAGCVYHAVFGEGTAHAGLAKSVARFGKVAVAAGADAPPRRLGARNRIGL